MTAAVRVLLVEDEPLIRLFLEEVLLDAGFEVVPAVDGEQALGELDADPRRFGALLTDVRLGPGPDGWSVAHHARVAVPGMPIVYMSGDSAREWAAKGEPKSVMVAKPFIGPQIVTALSKLLSQSAAL